MYILLGETKVTVETTSSDTNMLNITITKELGIEETYNLFAQNDLSTITVKDDQSDEAIDIFVGYKNIDGFYYMPSLNQINIALLKVDSSSLQEDLNNLNKRLSEIEQNPGSSVDPGLVEQQNYAFSVLTVNFTDEQALNCILLFPDWDPNGHEYKKDDRCKYNGELYKVLQDHTSQESWTPDAAHSLFVDIADPAIEWPDYKQPTGAHDAYNTGDKVTYNGQHYISKIDANVWAPDAYPAGWELVEEVEE